MGRPARKVEQEQTAPATGILDLVPSGGFKRDPAEVVLQGEAGEFDRADTEGKREACIYAAFGPNGLTTRIPRQSGESDQAYTDRLCATRDGYQVWWSYHAAGAHLKRLEQREKERQEQQEQRQTRQAEAAARSADKLPELAAVVTGASKAEKMLADLHDALMHAARARHARQRIESVHRRASEAAATLGRDAPAVPEVSAQSPEVETMLRLLGNADLLAKAKRDVPG